MSTKSMSLRTKAVLAVITALLATSIALGLALTRQSRHAMKTLIDDYVLDIVTTAAAMVDGDALKGITAEDKGTPDYNQLYGTLSKFDKNIGLEFIYAVRQTADGSYIFVLDPATENASEYGEIVHDTEALHAAGKGTAAVDEEPYRDSYGYFYSAYCPVYDSRGEVAGVIAADFDAEWYEQQIDKNTITIAVACALLAAIEIGRAHV